MHEVSASRGHLGLVGNGDSAGVGQDKDGDALTSS